MTRQEMATFMDRIYKEEIQVTREDGQKEYAHDEDNAFGNFERTGEDLGLDRETVLWVFAMKHRDGIAAHLNGHTSQREDVTGRIKDLIVYLFLLWGMIEQDRAGNQHSVKVSPKAPLGTDCHQPHRCQYPECGCRRNGA